MDDPGEPVILNVVQCHVPLVVGLRRRVGEVRVEGQVPVHDAGPPQHLGGLGRGGAGLDDDPEQRWRHQLQRVGQPPQKRPLQAVAGLGRGDHDQLSLGPSLEPLARGRRLGGCLDHQAPVDRGVSGRRSEPLARGRRLGGHLGHQAPVEGVSGRRPNGGVVAGEEGGGAGRGEAGEEAGHEAQGEVEERLLP